MNLKTQNLKLKSLVGGIMMKKVLIVLAVLTTASVANADLILNVDEPAGRITISGDGATAPPVGAYLLVEGLGSINGGNMVYPGTLSAYDDLEAIAARLSFTPQETLDIFRNFLDKPSLADISLMTFVDGAIPAASVQGILVDNIAFNRTGPIMLTLVSDDFSTVFDCKTVTAPEPMTMAMLGLGGLLLRRRSRR